MHYSGQGMLWLVGSLSSVFRIPLDAQLIRPQFPPPYSRTALLNVRTSTASDFKKTSKGSASHYFRSNHATPSAY